jgi:hypothetical protein
MRFESSRQRGIVSPRATPMILAVGQRAFVHHPGDSAYPIAMTDDQGLPAAAAMRDGDEVEILAWRPRGSTGTRYRVRRHADGANGWLAATELRRTAVRPAPATAEAPSQPSPRYFDTGRPFGSRA